MPQTFLQISSEHGECRNLHYHNEWFCRQCHIKDNNLLKTLLMDYLPFKQLFRKLRPDQPFVQSLLVGLHSYCQHQVLAAPTAPSHGQADPSTQSILWGSQTAASAGTDIPEGIIPSVPVWSSNKNLAEGLFFPWIWEIDKAWLKNELM